MPAMPLNSVVFEADPEKNASVVVTQSKRSRLLKHWRQDIRIKHSDIILLMCSFLSGLCDSGAFNAWSCFVCMQTGTSILRFSSLQSVGELAWKNGTAHVELQAIPSSWDLVQQDSQFQSLMVGFAR